MYTSMQRRTSLIQLNDGFVGSIDSTYLFIAASHNYM